VAHLEGELRGEGRADEEAARLERTLVRPAAEEVLVPQVFILCLQQLQVGGRDIVRLRRRRGFPLGRHGGAAVGVGSGLQPA